MIVARKLNSEDWIKIRTRYESGEVIRQIARDYDIALGTIQHRAKKEGWTKKLVSKLIEIRENFKDISKLTNIDQRKLVSDQLKTDLDQIMEIGQAIKSLQQRAVGVHNIILKKTYEGLTNGDISPIVASRTLQSQGIDTKTIMQTNGLSKEKSTTIQLNTQFNNDNTDGVIIEPQDAYLTLINE